VKDRTASLSFIQCTSFDLKKTIIERLNGYAQSSILSKGTFHIVLAGGNTPREFYQTLTKTNQQWQRWHIYFSDERCLPANDPERNSKMAKDMWLDHVPIPRDQIHIIPAEVGAKSAATSYKKTIVNVPVFDLVLLGLGEDGHIASLFPGNELGESRDAESVLPVLNSPKSPAERVSLSANRLSQAKRVIFMVSGDTKKDAMLRWQRGENIPASAIQPLEEVDVYYDTRLD
jgi:6-phosphogluconolactonase